MATIKVQRKSNENADQLLTRFNRRSTRFVKLTRNSRYRPGKISPLKKKQIALIRERYRIEAGKRKHYE